MFDFLFYCGCVFTFCPKTHYLSQYFAISFAMLIYLVYLTYCKIQGYENTDIASLINILLLIFYIDLDLTDNLLLAP